MCIRDRIWKRSSVFQDGARSTCFQLKMAEGNFHDGPCFVITVDCIKKSLDLLSTRLNDKVVDTIPKHGARAKEDCMREGTWEMELVLECSKILGLDAIELLV